MVLNFLKIATSDYKNGSSKHIENEVVELVSLPIKKRKIQPSKNNKSESILTRTEDDQVPVLKSNSHLRLSLNPRMNDGFLNKK